MAGGVDTGARGRVTLQDVAADAGVSRSTVSLVLRESPLVAEETRRRVLASMEALGYVYNRGAANLRASGSKTVGLLVTNIANPFFAELTAGVDHVMDAAGVAVFLANTTEALDKQERFLRRMREQNVDGVILCPAAGSDKDLVARMRQWRMPCIQTLRYLEARDGDYAGCDYRLGMVMAAEHLIRLGHRRIALVGGELVHSALTDRRAGFADALRRHGLPADLVLRTPLTRRAGAEAVTALLDRPDPPSAAIAFNDVVAFGMLGGLADRGLEVGRDFAVCGFDDVPDAALSRPALTTVSTQPFQIGKEAAKLLLRRIADPDGAPERVILPTRLIVRESCGGGGRRTPARRPAPAAGGV
ncbi:LacI family DNA-binding transcriptional regulator [Azospirillum sp. ST 5-10]|uniref:LacI family DNA-binding transcriptional regulator n=1 Tax=unclassified Azospirillum TaxID=2630922 RepID=UPI003F49B52B